MNILYVGIDLAKNVFAVHGVNELGKPAVVRPSIVRAKLHELMASLPRCVIRMEACSGAHHWARMSMQHGHTVRLLVPKLTKAGDPYLGSLLVMGAKAAPNAAKTKTDSVSRWATALA